VWDRLKSRHIRYTKEAAMKNIIIVKLSLLLLMTISPDILSVSTDSSIFGIFVATSPCDAGSRPLLKIPETANCEVIKWDLTLYHNPDTLAPTTYKLTYAYGLPKQGTNEIAQGGIKVEWKGKWTMVRGAKSNPDAVVYQLDPDSGMHAGFKGKSCSYDGRYVT
jgi:hypothetical protein